MPTESKTPIVDTLVRLESEYGSFRVRREINLYRNRGRLLIRKQNRIRHRSFSRAFYAQKWVEYDGKCPGYPRYCGRSLPKKPPGIELDRINPNLEGEAYNHPDNIQPLCPSCNKRKGSKSILQQARETGRSFKALLGSA